MKTARELRRCALQAMYQFDAGGVEEPEGEALEAVRRSLEHASGGDRARADGLALAVAAWAVRADADAAVALLSPDWPTYRQPVVDRNILRLAYHEMTAGDTPPKVAINEAVELAKEFSTEKSPLFVNGVLDRIFRQLRGEPDEPVDAPDEDDHEAGDHPAIPADAPETPEAPKPL